jgi:hypothetical protein
MGKEVRMKAQSRCVRRRETVKNLSRSLAIIGLTSTLLTVFPLNGCRRPAMDIHRADQLYQEGKFEDAETAYEALAASEPDHYDALLTLGKLNLYKNSFKKSEQWLRKAMELQPEEEGPRSLLAELYYRQDRFNDAAPLFRALGKEGMADKLESMGNRTPYLVESDVDVTSVGFVRTDPLPLVKLRINGVEALFVIDTGGWELSIDPELAETVGARRFGGQLATYAGGLQDTTYHGTVDWVQAGDFTIKNVPVNISNAMKGFATALREPIRGVIGTVFLYHFIFTIDYPDGKLILQRKTEKNIESMRGLVGSKENIAVPFWMSGDHIIVAWGTVNQSEPVLFFVDTGLAGGGFMGTDWLAEKANIQLPEETQEGVGGGGKVRFKTAVLDEVTLGDARETDVVGVFGGTPNLGDRFGYRIAGIISHGFFRPFKLTFDFTTMHLLLERPES